jgi:P27 family predicted phage terminase small subunit
MLGDDRSATLVAAETPAPGHLSVRAADFWGRVLADYALTVAESEILLRACEALDRCDQAIEELRAHGALTVTTKDSVKPHPCVAVERDSRLAFVRCIRELDLDGLTGPAPYDPRPARR